MLRLFILNSSPRLGVMYLLGISITILLNLKARVLRVRLYICLVLISTGVLLLLFYTCIVRDKFLYWTSKSTLLLTCAPLTWKRLRYQGSSLTLWLEILKSKIVAGFICVTLILVLLLIVVNTIPRKVKFIRQIV